MTTNYIITMNHVINKKGVQTDNIAYNCADGAVIDDCKAIAAAISAYAVTTYGVEVPTAVYAYNKAVWAAAQNITSLKKLKDLAVVRKYKLTSNDVNFIISLLIADDRTAVGGTKIVGAKKGVQTVLQCLYCKQEGIDYSVKSRPVTNKTKKGGEK